MRQACCIARLSCLPQGLFLLQGHLLLLPWRLVEDTFLLSLVKVVDMVQLGVDGLDVVDELKVLARVDGVHGDKGPRCVASVTVVVLVFFFWLLAVAMPVPGDDLTG